MRVKQGPWLRSILYYANHAQPDCLSDHLRQNQWEEHTEKIKKIIHEEWGDNYINIEDRLYKLYY